MPILFEASMPITNFVPPIQFKDLCKEPPAGFKSENHDVYCGKSFDIMKTANLIQLMDNETYGFQEKVKTDIKVHEDEYIEKRQRRGLIDPLRSTLGEIANYCCGVATTRSFNQLFANQEEITSAMKNIKESVHENHRSYMSITSHVDQISAKLNQNFMSIKNQFDNYKQKDTKSQYFMESWTEMVSHSLIHLFARNVEQTRQNMRSAILENCRNNLLPAMIVDQDSLMKELINIKGKIESQGWTFSIPIISPSSYYQHKISECILSNEKILIKLKVPLRRITPKYNLFTFLSVPQGFNNRSCTLLIDDVHLALSETGDEIIPVAGNDRRFCEASSTQGSNLCYLARRPSQVTFTSNCAESIYHGEPIKRLFDVCAYRCIPETQPIITAISSEIYVITHPQKNITIVCDDEIILLPEDHLKDPGSLEITLKCECELHMQGKLIIPKNFPCSHDINRDVSVTHILPALWSHYKDFRINPAKAKFNALLLDKFNESFNVQWMHSVPLLDITPPKPVLIPEMHPIEKSESNFAIDSFISIFVILICAIIFKVLLKICKTIKIRDMDEETDLNIVHSERSTLH